jgi:hypothetical protein
METYPRAAVERAMKIQEVILRVVAKKITWAQAGEIIGVCERQMRRWKERYEEFGYDGLFDHRLGTGHFNLVTTHPLVSGNGSEGNRRYRTFNIWQRTYKTEIDY